MLETIKKYSGFTLVEMAIVLVIFGLILSSFLIPLATQIDAKNYLDNRKNMVETKEALLGYVASNGYFPCPAVSSSDGSESARSSGKCSKRIGFLPWAALGLNQSDSWGHLYGYSVTPAYTDSSNKIGLNTSADITIKTRDSAGNLVLTSNTSAIPAVIISYGKNGYYGYSSDGTQVSNPSSTNIDEITNGTSATVFVNRDFTMSQNAGGGQFDDVIFWFSQYQIVGQLVKVGKLP